MKHIILYNKLAGHARAHQTVEQIAEKYESSLLIDLTEADAYTKLYVELCSEDEIVICGGDGTLNHFVNNTKHDPLPNRIFYCAMGSGNDFLRDIGADGEHIIEITEHLKNLPSVTVNGVEYLFINGIGFGIDGYCCEVGDALKAKSDKPVNYALIAIKGLLFHFKPRNAIVRVDGIEYKFRKCWICPTMNGRYYGGGMMPTPNQDRHNPDGKLSFLSFHGSGKLKTLAIFPSLFKGGHVKHTNHVTIIEGREFEVIFDVHTALQIDGETVTQVTSYKVSAAVTSYATRK